MAVPFEAEPKIVETFELLPTSLICQPKFALGFLISASTSAVTVTDFVTLLVVPVVIVAKLVPEVNVCALVQFDVPPPVVSPAEAGVTAGVAGRWVLSLADSGPVPKVAWPPLSAQLALF